MRVSKQRDRLSVKACVRALCLAICMQSTAALFTYKIFERCRLSFGNCVCFLLQSLYILFDKMLEHRGISRLFTVTKSQKTAARSALLTKKNTTQSQLCNQMSHPKRDTH